MSETKEQQPAYISRVHLKGYKSIRDLEIDFKAGLNIIIGPNGSGKTNFLEFLEFSILSFYQTIPIHIRQNFSSHIEAFGSDSKVIDWDLKGGYRVESVKKIPRFVIHQTIRVDKKDTFIKSVSTFINGQERSEITFLPNDSNVGYINFDNVKYLRFINPLNLLLNQGIGLEFINGVYSHDENDEPVGDPSTIILFNEPSDLFGVDLLLFESFEVNYKEGNLKPLKERFNISKDFRKTLKRFTIIKDLDLDLDIARTYDSANLDNLFFKFFVNNKWLYWNQLSDGTKRLFYIFVNTFFEKSRTPIFIEEPELGIHPDQLYLLMDFLKEQSKEKQIIITTHSPEVLNILNKEELDRIIVTRYDAEKGTRMHHLSPKKIKKGVNYMSKEGLTLKDFWVHSNLEEYDEEEYEIR